MKKITGRAMAKALGVSHTTVQADIKAGMPMSSVENARLWRKNHGRLKIDAPGEGETNLLDEDLSAESSDTQEYKAARAEREKLRAERERIELEKIKGNLIPLDAACDVVFTLFRGYRDNLSFIPERVAPKVILAVKSGKDQEVVSLIMDELNTTLELSENLDALRETFLGKETENEEGDE